MKNTDISRVSPDRSADVIYRPQLPLVERRGGWFVSAISELYKIFFFYGTITVHKYIVWSLVASVIS